jgi:UDPglucose--hexose-1-phosphate uridylyltransferase
MSCRFIRPRPTAKITAHFIFISSFIRRCVKPNLLKYLGGPEIGGGNFLSDTSAEDKAAELRSMSDIHYKSEAKS